MIKYAEKAFQDKTLDEITSNDIQKLLVGIKAGRIRDLCKINLSQLFKKAVIQGIIKNNPCDAVEIKRHKASHKKALTRAEQEIFLRAASQTKHSLLYRFLLSTGLRILPCHFSRSNYSYFAFKRSKPGKESFAHPNGRLDKIISSAA